MIKAKLLIGAIMLSVLALLVGACAPQPSPAPIPPPVPTPTPVPTPAPTPQPTLTGVVEVYVTDAPPRDEVTSVNVTVSKLEIHKAVAEQEQEQSGSGNQTQEQEQEQQQTQQGEGEWITIDISDNATTFDLLKIKGIEQFFASSEVEAGKYTQIRLTIDKVEVTLSDNNSQEATVPSKELKFVRPFDVVTDETTTILIDFDADKSVTVTGAGEIIVKPVVKLIVSQGKDADQNGGQKPQTEITEQASIEVSCDDFMSAQHISKELEVAAGDAFTVTLCSNPTTGFQWSESAQISDETVIEQTGHKFLPPGAKGNKPPAPGTPGQEAWTFKAPKEGEATISMEYSRPWEGGKKREWTFELIVVVK